jgi:hypothetical protein
MLPGCALQKTTNNKKLHMLDSHRHQHFCHNRTFAACHKWVHQAQVTLSIMKLLSIVKLSIKHIKYNSQTFCTFIHIINIFKRLSIISYWDTAIQSCEKEKNTSIKVQTPFYTITHKFLWECRQNIVGKCLIVIKHLWEAR